MIEIIDRKIQSKQSLMFGKIIDVGEKYIIITWNEIKHPMPIHISKFLQLVNCDEEVEEFVKNKIGDVSHGKMM